MLASSSSSTNPSSGSLDLTGPSSNGVQDLSCFELLPLLRTTMYLDKDVLISKISSATKDSSGKISWVDFTPDFHAHLLKVALKAIGCSLAAPSFRMAKKCLFIFILELLNDSAAKEFFAAQSECTKVNRLNREKKRLARKRARAAKRERSREASALKKVVGSDSTVCTVCGRKFASRKTLSKHKCVTVAVEKARAAKVKSSSVQPTQTTAPAPPTAPQQTTENPPPVIAESEEISPVQGVPIELGMILSSCKDEELSAFIVHCWANNRGRLRGTCEDCDKPRRAFKTHGGFDAWYPKCIGCAPMFDVMVVPQVVWDWIGPRL